MHEMDETMMIAVRNGDVGKLETLFDHHHRLLYNFFAQMTGSRVLADDVVQDVFFRILKYRKTFRDDSCFRSWMFHIALNARTDYFRRHSGEVVLPEDDVHIENPSPYPGQELGRRKRVDYGGSIQMRRA